MQSMVCGIITSQKLNICIISYVTRVLTAHLYWSLYEDAVELSSTYDVGRTIDNIG